MSGSNDSPELEALFDSISESMAPARPASVPELGDTPELEALFDRISDAVVGESDPNDDGVCPQRVFAQLGHMTRNLHNLLRELGFDKALEEVANGLPDNRDRLNYIAAMTAKAAERTLTAAEVAQPLQENMGATARVLSDNWERLFNKQLGVQEFKTLVHDTRAYLAQVPQQTETTNAQLMEIILAQDFQDLTGQVIKKILDAAQKLESQLLALLIETTPEDKRHAVDTGLLNGPVVNSAHRSDVVTSQEQVDDLLESLGF
ncbi:MAG: protein phosphatase CheZ [Betaproteobacteria bacterium]|nr:protein phosphatase CheZ [Betaproteobacteria bacterium]